jgi:hypothetical protein
VSKQRIGIVLLTILLLFIIWIAPAQAQGGGWSGPYRLSSEDAKASEAYLVADPYGYVHSFWSETLFETQQTIIQYARFDGVTWSSPNDFYITSHEIDDISPVVDQHGTLHVVWTEGYSGPVYYTYAPASNALSARDWARPIRINIPAGLIRLGIDSKGIFHILYVNRTADHGVFYVRSEDQGETWSEPIWLDPDILPHHTPDGLNFVLDENDRLHAVWWYGGLERSRPDWVRYTHSLDGGLTWSKPFMIDRYNEEGDHNLTNAGPKMIVQGQTVHVIWAAGSLPYRNHRFSSDGGLTWSAPVRILGELHGQAGDSLTIDGAGRVHFVGQIRYPIAIYDAYWDQNQWSEPSLVYLVAEIGDEIMGDRVHAHSIKAVVRAGNQLVVTFGDPSSDPASRLFVMYRNLDDVLPLESMPTPVPAATLVPMSSATPNQPTSMPKPTATAPSLESSEVQLSGNAPAPDLAIRVALVPTLILLGVTIFFRLRQKNRS